MDWFGWMQVKLSELARVSCEPAVGGVDSKLFTALEMFLVLQIWKGCLCSSAPSFLARRHGSSELNSPPKNFAKYRCVLNTDASCAHRAFCRKICPLKYIREYCLSNFSSFSYHRSVWLASLIHLRYCCSPEISVIQHLSRAIMFCCKIGIAFNVAICIQVSWMIPMPPSGWGVFCFSDAP